MSDLEKIINFFGEEKALGYIVNGLCCPEIYNLKNNCAGNTCVDCWKEALKEYNPE